MEKYSFLSKEFLNHSVKANSFWHTNLWYMRESGILWSILSHYAESVKLHFHAGLPSGGFGGGWHMLFVWNTPAYLTSAKASHQTYPALTLRVGRKQSNDQWLLWFLHTPSRPTLQYLKKGSHNIPDKTIRELINCCIHCILYIYCIYIYS